MSVLKLAALAYAFVLGLTLAAASAAWAQSWRTWPSVPAYGSGYAAPQDDDGGTPGLMMVIPPAAPGGSTMIYQGNRPPIMCIPPVVPNGATHCY